MLLFTFSVTAKPPCFFLQKFLERTCGRVASARSTCILPTDVCMIDNFSCSTLSLTHFFSHSPFLSLSFSLHLTHSFSPCLSFLLFLSPPISLSLSFYLSIYLFISLSLTHTHTLINLHLIDFVQISTLD